MVNATDFSRLVATIADRYRIERELGAGGMATVYLARDLKHDRKVAIKVLKPDLAAVLGAVRFVVETKTTAALQHPHILPLFDSGEAGGFLYYVMPFIDGETLRAKLDRETQLGIEESVKIATDVADALQYAHEHGVVHRDIKPENILLANGRPMVADFGIALAVSAAAGGRMTETGLSLGTPHYMSPEQATAEKEITARSDIYSLGSVLYELLTGEPPHPTNLHPTTRCDAAFRSTPSWRWESPRSLAVSAPHQTRICRQKTWPRFEQRRSDGPLRCTKAAGPTPPRRTPRTPCSAFRTPLIKAGMRSSGTSRRTSRCRPRSSCASMKCGDAATWLS